MGNANDTGLCQEVAAWQRKNLSRDPETGWVHARPVGVSYVQDEQLTEWRPSKAGPSGQRSGGRPERRGPAAGVQPRSQSMFASPAAATWEMMSPETARLQQEQMQLFGGRRLGPSASKAPEGPEAPDAPDAGGGLLRDLGQGCFHREQSPETPGPGPGTRPGPGIHFEAQRQGQGLGPGPGSGLGLGPGPVRQSSAHGQWRRPYPGCGAGRGPGPLRQCSAPVRRSSCGSNSNFRPESRGGLTVCTEEGGFFPMQLQQQLQQQQQQHPFASDDREAPGLSLQTPQAQGSFGREQHRSSYRELPARPYTPRAKTSLSSRETESALPWDSFPTHSDESGPARRSSWGEEEGAGAGTGALGARRGARAERETSPPRIEDTSIGKGLSEFLKRGVAQAAPRAPEQQPEVVVHLKEGSGFVATIQKGFEGIFGHLATSKEEVLRKRGPMPAPEYEAVPGDDIDQRVAYYARQLPPHLGDCLQIYRLSKGEYRIGGDELRLAWQAKVNPPSMQNPNGFITREVFVFTTNKENVEDEGPGHSSSCCRGRDGKEVPCEPLPLYLRHSANVAYDLQYGSKVTKIPESSRLSFAEETGTLLKDSDPDSKYNAMTLAIQQVRKREQAAMEWRKRNAADGPAASSIASRDSLEREVGGPPLSPSKERSAAAAAAESALLGAAGGAGGSGSGSSPSKEKEKAKAAAQPMEAAEAAAPERGGEAETTTAGSSLQAPLPPPPPPQQQATTAAPAPGTAPSPGPVPIRGLDPPVLRLPAPVGCLPPPPPLTWGQHAEASIMQPPMQPAAFTQQGQFALRSYSGVRV